MDAFSQHPLSWDDVRVLLALVRDGTYKGAGKRLGVAPSTVGRRLDAMEEALGVRLFDRTPDGVQPTVLVEQLLPFAEQVEGAASALVNAVEGFESKPEGVVRLTAPPGLMDYFVIPRLPEFRQRFPGIRLELDASVTYADLTRREADLALRVLRPTTGDLVSQRLAEEEEVLFASPKLVAKWGTLRSLEGLPFLTWGPALASIPSARWVSKVISDANVVLRTSSASALIAAAEAGLGVLLIARAYGRVTELEELRLSPTLKASLPPTATQALWLVGHRALRTVPRVAAVWDFLVASFHAGK